MKIIGRDVADLTGVILAEEILAMRLLLTPAYTDARQRKGELCVMDI